MSKIQYLYDCPSGFSFEPSFPIIHYTVIVEDGVQYNICTSEDKQQIIKYVELLHICINLFGNVITDVSCGGYLSSDWFYFPDKSRVFIDGYFNYYHVSVACVELFCTSDLYAMLEHLKEMYTELMMPIKTILLY